MSILEEGKIIYIKYRKYEVFGYAYFIEDSYKHLITVRFTMPALTLGSHEGVSELMNPGP